MYVHTFAQKKYIFDSSVKLRRFRLHTNIHTMDTYVCIKHTFTNFSLCVFDVGEVWLFDVFERETFDRM